MSHRFAGILTILGGLAALGLAYFAQFVLLLAPCPLCLWERWPYRIIIVLGLATLISRPATGRVFLALAALVLLAGAAIAGLHVGVEWHFWPSPLPECNSMLTPGAALPMIPAKPCDEPSFLIPGLPVSMAAMDGIFALAFAIFLLSTATRSPRRFSK